MANRREQGEVRSGCREYESSSSALLVWDRLWQTELQKTCRLISVSILSKMFGNCGHSFESSFVHLYCLFVQDLFQPLLVKI